MDKHDNKQFDVDEEYKKQIAEYRNIMTDRYNTVQNTSSVDPVSEANASCIGTTTEGT